MYKLTKIDANPIMMDKYIIFSNFVLVIKKSCVYTGFMSTITLFSRISIKFLYICRIYLQNVLISKKIMYFCRINSSGWPRPR